VLRCANGEETRVRDRRRPASPQRLVGSVNREPSERMIESPMSAAEPQPQTCDLIRFPRSRWSLWPAVLVRGAGFSTTAASQLSAPDCETPEAFDAELRRIRGCLREIAGRRAFREAVLWQNPSALHHAVDHVIATPVDRVNSATRRKYLLVASY